MRASDEELMERTVSGEHAAFEELFDRHHPPVLAFLYRFLGDSAAAEDAAQEVFWRVWRHRESYGEGRPFTPWLYSIARRAALDELKRPHRRARTGGQEPLPPEEEGATPEEMARRLFLTSQVRQALGALSANERLCLILREYQGFTYREIAEVMGCTEGNARLQAFRARSTLRELLRRVLEGEESRV